MREVTQGQIYQLGAHVLGCGSSLDRDFVSSVLKNKEIRCILTDPPYGVAYVESGGDVRAMGTIEGGVRPIAGDQLQTPKEYAEFTRQWLSAATQSLASYNACYIFNADSMFCALRSGMDQAGFYYSQMIVWVKNTVVIGRKDYLPQHELIAYGWHGRHKMERSKAKSIIAHPKPASSKLHPTMKPIGLLRKMLPNSTKAGEWAYDPFGGSGSTLIACEQLGRKCAMIEMDPTYCATIIARWEKLTGEEAKLIH